MHHLNLHHISSPSWRNKNQTTRFGLAVPTSSVAPVKSPHETWLWSHLHPVLGIGHSTEHQASDHPKRHVERMTELCRLLDNPQDATPVIVVSGTNGKTSTARMISTLLHHSGLHVGTATGPHLQSINERIAVDGKSISDAELEDIFKRIADIETSISQRPSVFDILTLSAFEHSRSSGVDVMVVEVGIESKYDTTSVVDGAVYAVTNVSYDHAGVLGRTVTEMAVANAEVIPPHRPLAISVEDADLLRPFLAGRNSDNTWRLGTEFDVQPGVGKPSRADYRTPLSRFPDIHLPLLGSHQQKNAALALAAVELFRGEALPVTVARSAMSTVSSPGRLEIVATRPNVILDAAHNEAGMASLRLCLDQHLPAATRTLLVAIPSGRPLQRTLAALDWRPEDRFIICPAEKGPQPAEVRDAAVTVGFPADRITIASSAESGFDLAKRTTPVSGQVVVVGFNPAGRVRDLLGLSVGQTTRNAGVSLV